MAATGKFPPRLRVTQAPRSIFPAPTPLLLLESDAARMLAITPRSLRRLAVMGFLEISPLGRGRVIDRTAVEALLGVRRLHQFPHRQSL